MRHLPVPCSDADDDAVVTSLCKGEDWKPHLKGWLAAYSEYRQAGSDPWKVTPTVFNPDAHDPQYELYDARKRGGPIRRIRDTRGLLSCPMCGSHTTGSLDHVLPRAVYPEFSIMRANLVPACMHCNSASKGNKHRGPVPPERFIHPYFDAFAGQPLWSVQIVPPFAAATFNPVPMPGLTVPQASIVRYHLTNVLGDEFTRRMETAWSTLPGSLHASAAGAPITYHSIAAQLAVDLTRAIITRGENGWDTAFLRGVAADPAAVAHVTERATNYPL